MEFEDSYDSEPDDTSPDSGDTGGGDNGGQNEEMASEAFGIPWTDQWSDWEPPQLEPSGDGSTEGDQGRGWAELRNQYNAANIGAGGGAPPWRWGSWFDATQPSDMLPNGLPAGARPPANPYEAEFYQNNALVGNGAFGPPTVLAPPEPGSDTWRLERGYGNDKISIPLPESVDAGAPPSSNPWVNTILQNNAAMGQGSVGGFPAPVVLTPPQSAGDTWKLEQGFGNNKISIPVPGLVEGGFHPNPARYLPGGGIEPMTWDEYQRQQQVRDLQELLAAPALPFDRERQLAQLRELRDLGYDVGFHPNPDRYLPEGGTKPGGSPLDVIGGAYKYSQVWPLALGAGIDEQERYFKPAFESLSREDQDVITAAEHYPEFAPPMDGAATQRLDAARNRFADKLNELRAADMRTWQQRMQDAHATYEKNVPLLPRTALEFIEPRSLATGWLAEEAFGKAAERGVHALPLGLAGIEFLRSLGEKGREWAQGYRNPSPSGAPSSTEVPFGQNPRQARAMLQATQPLQQTSQMTPFTGYPVARGAPFANAAGQATPPSVPAYQSALMSKLLDVYPALPANAPAPAPMKNQTAIAAPEFQGLSTAGRQAAGEILQSHGFAPNGGLYQLTTPRPAVIAPEELSNLPLRDQQILANIFARKGWMGR